ncbi:MAG: hypothetical protein KGO01_17035, partial [Burkholderiales bacterium]|nr:hypothetical protein [Burkholderiales bacterium]
MFDQALSVLLVAAEAQAARLQADGCVCTAAAQAGAARDFDAVVFGAPDRAALVALRQRAELAQAAFDSAVLVHSPVQDLALELELLSLGVEAFVAAPADLVRALRHAVMRKRVERSARTAYATDLATGLPHQAQLIEHMTQLLALREREPAPMVLLV